MRNRLLPRQETAHSLVTTLQADTFHVGSEYENWRLRGTPDWLLILTIGGAGRVQSAESEIHSQRGVVTLYQPGTPQSYFTDPETGNWDLLWCHFHPRPHWEAWMNWPEVTRGLRVLTLEDPVIHRHVRSALTEVTRFSRLELPGSMDLAINALERALLWIHSINNQSTLDERIRLAINFLAEHLNSPFSLEALARTCGLSVSRLAHLFRDQTGQPPQRYLENLRLQRAAQLLRSTSLRIKEVAAESGYDSAFYFTTRFRKKFGETPSEYRRSFK